MTRYLSGVSKQLQGVSDLFAARYGSNSSITELALKALVSSSLLEHELMLLDDEASSDFASRVEEAAAATAH